MKDEDIIRRVEHREKRITNNFIAALKRKLFLSDASPPITRALKRWQSWFGIDELTLTKTDEVK